MIYGSVCSGIEAATVAWHDLDLQPAWFAEIADFPSRVLAARWPHVPNRGDFTRIGHEAPPETVDVLVGGTPCQSFSVAGGRAGLDDPRGHLAVEFVRLARRLSARWVVWENVPGVLSVDGGDAFGAFVSLLAEVGYGVFWRVLDARWFGVPQRRRRVFLVGYLGDWRPAAAVLLERPSMRGNPATRGSARSKAPSGIEGSARALVEGSVTDALTSSMGSRGATAVPLVVDDAIGTLGAHHYRNAPDDAIVADTLRRSGMGRAPDHGNIAVVPLQTSHSKQNGCGVGEPGAPMYTGTTRGDHAVAFHTTQDPIHGSLAPCLGTEPGHVGILAFDEQQITHPENRSRVAPGEPSPTLASQSRVAPGEPSPTLASQSRVDVFGSFRPRRLTPREWERLQGFPDDYTAIDGAEDSPRYEALGNSMAVPVMRWIGRRLVAVDRIVRGRAG